jgi:hypothetical protein
MWIELRQEMMRRLDALTLEDLCCWARDTGIVGRTAACGRLQT